MKNARIGLLVLSVFAFAKMECQSTQTSSSKKSPVKKSVRSTKLQKRFVAPRRAAQSSRPVIVEEDSHKIEVNEEMLQPGQIVQASVDTHVTENTEDNTITEVTVTVTPMPEEGKVVTTTETWTWKDYAKVAAGVGLAAGASYAAYKYHTDPTFAGKVNDSGSWASEQANSAYQSGSQAIASGYERTKAFGQEVGQSLDNAWQATAEKANDLSQQAQSRWSNWRSGSVSSPTTALESLPTAPEFSAPAESSDMNESALGQDAMNALQQSYGNSLPSPVAENQPTKSSWFNRFSDSSIATGGDL